MGILVRQEGISVPTVVGSSGQLLVTQILGVPLVALLLHGIDRGGAFAEGVGLRHAGRRNVALCVAFAALAVVLTTVVHLVWDRPAAVSLARNQLGSSHTHSHHVPARRKSSLMLRLGLAFLDRLLVFGEVGQSSALRRVGADRQMDRHR